jgi:autotransporter-associated beta strand protein
VSNKLTLKGSGASGTGALASVSGNSTWTGSVVLGAASAIGIDANQLTISGVVSGAFALTKAGAGTLVLSGPNTYTGGATVSAGILNIQNAKGLGTGTGTVSTGASLQIQGGISVANKLTLNGAGASGNGALESVSGNNTCTGTVDLATATTIGADAGQLTLSGVISGTGSLTKVGSGTLLLSGTNAYSGLTTVSAGTLGGSGTIGAVQVDAGATLAPGSTNTGILSTGTVAFASGSAFNVKLNGTTAGSGFDQLNATGTVNLNGATLNVSLGTTTIPVNGSVTIIQATTSVAGTFAGPSTITVGTETFQITYNNTSVVLTRKT